MELFLSSVILVSSDDVPSSDAFPSSWIPLHGQEDVLGQTEPIQALQAFERRLFECYNLDMDLLSFIRRKTYEGEVVDLREKYRVSERSSYDGVPTVYYDVLRHEDKQKIGTIDLRLSAEGSNYYYGNVGYNIQKEYRGNHYAYHACRVLFKIARDEFRMDELIITCSPENEASYRTLKKLDGEFIELVEVPARHLLYSLGEKSKYIFRYKINL